MTPRLMSPAGALLPLAIFVVAALAQGGCLQKEGDKCQTSSDCKGDLICCFDGMSADSTLGVCTAAESCTPLPDADIPDAATDGGVSHDSASPDAMVYMDAQPNLDASPTMDASF